jgi:hypothetical protein
MVMAEEPERYKCRYQNTMDGWMFLLLLLFWVGFLIRKTSVITKRRIVVVDYVIFCCMTYFCKFLS